MMISEDNVRLHTLCWSCKHATNGRVCCWAGELKPVKGWVAIPTVIKEYQTESAYVTESPKFQEDDKKPSKVWKASPENAFSSLVEAIVDRAIRDWKWADYIEKGKRRWSDSQITPEGMKKDVENFFRGKWFKSLCDGIDGNKIIEKLQKGEL